MSPGRIRATVILRLAELYSEYRGFAPTVKPPGWKSRKRRGSERPPANAPGTWVLNQLTLAEAKALCDEAWGEWRREDSLLPSLAELQAKISEWGIHWVQMRARAKCKSEEKELAAGAAAEAAERDGLMNLDMDSL